MGNIWSTPNNYYDENLYIGKFSSNEKTGYNFYNGSEIWSTLEVLKTRGELSDLMLACALGTKNDITVLVDNSDVNEKNKNGFTALMFASAFRDSDVVKFLIRNGADVNDSSQEGFTPLSLACLFENYENVVTLLRNGADVNVKCYNGMDSLSIASSISQMDIADILMEYGANIDTIDNNGNTLLMQTLKYNPVRSLFNYLEDSKFLFTITGTRVKSQNNICKKIKHLAEIGANVSSKNNDGESVIILSTTFKLNKVFYCLMELGADINDVTNDGQTPLTISLKNGNKELSKFLIEHGANVNVVNKRGQSALDIACIFSWPDIILEMLEVGAQVNVGTPLITACQFQKEDIVKIFVELGANINETDNYGYTPLMMACRNQKGDIVKMLLELGARPNAVSAFGDTPLMMACIGQNKEIIGTLIELTDDIRKSNIGEWDDLLAVAFIYRDLDISLFLIEKGADPSSLRFLEFDQYKAIHFATKQNDIEKVQLCLDLGINVDEVTLETKRSALYYATKREYLDIMKLLIVNGANIYLDDEPRDDRYPFSPLRFAIRNDYDLDAVKLFELSPMFDPYYVLLDPWVAFEYVEYFLKGDVDVNAQNQCGGTMLHNAVFQRNKRLVDFLLKMGARTDIMDDYGNTAMNVNAICWEHGGAYRF